MSTTTNHQSAMTSIIRQLITEYHGKGMSLADILERQIEAGHPAHEFIRVYKEMYPAESTRNPSTATSTPPTPIPEPTLGPLAEGRPMLFACKYGYFDLVECRFVPTKTADADKLNCGVPLRGSVLDIKGYFVPAHVSGMKQLQNFLDQIFPVPEMQNYVLNLYAEKLDGVHRRDEFVIHLGSGANGKSVFQSLLQETFGDYYQNHCVVKPNTRIALFDYDWLIKEVDFIKASSNGEKYNRCPGYACVYDFSMCMINTEVNEMPTIHDAGLKHRIRVIHYPSIFVEANDTKLADPTTYPNHFPRDYEIRQKVKELSAFFLEMLFERYKTLKSNGFRQLKNEIPVSARLV